MKCALLNCNSTSSEFEDDKKISFYKYVMYSFILI